MIATTAGAMHVMAGVMLDSLGRVLLAQRPPGKHLAGLWEFPGGKLEAGRRQRMGWCVNFMKSSAWRRPSANR